MKAASTVTSVVPADALIVNSPGHEYDGRRVTFEALFSERQKIMVHVEHEVYITLRLDEVLPAPSTTRSTTLYPQGALIA